MASSIIGLNLVIRVHHTCPAYKWRQPDLALWNELEDKVILISFLSHQNKRGEVAEAVVKKSKEIDGVAWFCLMSNFWEKSWSERSIFTETIYTLSIQPGVDWKWNDAAHTFFFKKEMKYTQFVSMLAWELTLNFLSWIDGWIVPFFLGPLQPQKWLLCFLVVLFKI